jgi:hypothetical protein
MKHDTIYVYGKTDTAFFNIEEARIPYSNEYIASHFTDVDENGKQCRKRFDAGKWRTYYPEEGMIPNDVWDIPYENSMSKDRVDFATQKPVALLHRVVKSTTKIKNIVMDYHVGSGTTIAVAHQSARKWIGIEMGEHFYTVVIPRMKKVLSGVKSGISKDVEFKGGGLFKYYELEQYEQILSVAKYGDVPEPWLNHLKNGETTNCFLFDERLSEAVVGANDSYSIDLSKLYAGIDIKETLHNVYGQRVKSIDGQNVIFADGKALPLLQLLKPLLAW